MFIRIVGENHKQLEYLSRGKTEQRIITSQYQAQRKNFFIGHPGNQRAHKVLPNSEEQ